MGQRTPQNGQVYHHNVDDVVDFWMIDIHSNKVKVYNKNQIFNFCGVYHHMYIYYFTFPYILLLILHSKSIHNIPRHANFLNISIWFGNSKFFMSMSIFLMKIVNLIINSNTVRLLLIIMQYCVNNIFLYFFFILEFLINYSTWI